MVFAVVSVFEFWSFPNNLARINSYSEPFSLSFLSKFAFFWAKIT
ncbi:hypothetical protein SRH_01920 [Mesomycoplasma hyorhinis MCLD]|uniref:Uncharacterized protein n=1 Tax=Mesomycoplasma hyorhinis (strain MCLD) TaxID=936139 RepID=A0ABM5M5L1_MESHM|nr:hypothetical protein SRH_01920 [Mesomycoplasma hyorhinis MCLD]